MDLALNNLQRLICHKTQQTNQPITNIIKRHIKPIEKTKTNKTYPLLL